MRIAKFAHEILASPYYRRRPLEVCRFAYAKWVFSRFRLDNPSAFLLQALGIDPVNAFAGYERWRPVLAGVVESVWTSSGRHGGISMEDGMILYGITRALQPAHVIETGVAAGVSTSFIGAALIENRAGSLFSIELPPEQCTSRRHQDGASFDWPQLGVAWALPQEIRKGLGTRHTLLLEDVKIALPALLCQLPHVDIFFHDDLHTPDHMLWEYELVWPHIRPGGVLISDDANFGWIQFARRQEFDKRALLNVQRLTAVRKHAGD